MAKPSKRLFAVLSLIVLLQQFSPVFTADLSRFRKNHKKKTVQHSTKDDKQEIQENSEKRFRILGTFLRGSWRLLGKASVIKKIKIFVDITSTLTAVTNIGLTVTKAIGGCGAIAPSLTESWNNYKSLNEEFWELGTQIDQIDLQAETRQIYINTSFYEYRRTRDRLEQIANEKEIILKSIGIEVITIVKNTTYDIGKLVEEKNATGQEITDIEVYQGFKKGLDLATDLLFPSVGLVYTGLKYFWRLYLRDTIIGKYITELPSTIKDAIVTSNDPDKPSLGKRIRSSRIMNTRFGKGLQNIGNGLKTKLVRAADRFKSFAKRVAPLVSLAGAAFGIWSVFAQVKECTDMADKAKDSVTKMTSVVEQTKEILNGVTIANAEIQSAFDEIHNYTVDPILLDALSRLRDMMNDRAIIKETTVTGEVVAGLQAFINGTDIDTQPEINKLTLNNLQISLNKALYRIPTTLQCYSEKGSFYNKVKSLCACGEGSMKSNYARVTRLNINDEKNKRCTDRTGELYPPLANVTAAWEKWVSENQTYDAICLMNNEWVVGKVIEELQKGNTNPTKIAGVINEDEAEEEIQAMIEKLRDDPRINELPFCEQDFICTLKSLGIDAARGVNAVNTRYENRPITEEEYNNQTCPPEGKCEN